MAGSGFPPLPNIPYCCLPQESGPCLSTSVGDRPLRSPSHRRLGGPSPRRLANGTHARPRPPEGFRPRGMPRTGRMAYHPAFPPAVRPSGVGCIRVTHPSATLGPPKGALPFDLHVLGLPPAFILSQDQTLRCTIALYLSCLCFSGPAFAPSIRFPIRPTPRLSASAPDSCAGLSLSMNSPPDPLKPRASRPESGCKSTTFQLNNNHFFHLFFIISAISLNYNEKKFMQTMKKGCLLTAFRAFLAKN